MSDKRQMRKPGTRGRAGGTLTDNIVAKTQDSVYPRRKRRPSFTFHTAYARFNSRTELETHLARNGGLL